MKRIFLIVICIMTMVLVQGQEKKIMLGASANFDYTKYGSIKNTYLNLMPKVGYKLNDNWTIGMGLGISHQQSNTYYQSGKSTFAYVSPFARYEKNISDNWFITTEPTIYGIFDTEDNGAYYGLGSSAGLLYKPLPSIGLELQLVNLNFLYEVGDSEGYTINFNYAFTTPTIGVYYYF